MIAIADETVMLWTGAVSAALLPVCFVWAYIEGLREERREQEQRARWRNAIDVDSASDRELP